MKTSILLVNFREKEQETVAKMGIDVDLGYISDAFSTIAKDGSSNQGASFYSPLAIYEYKIIFVKLTKTPPLKDKFEDKAKIISEKQIINFLQYWHKNRGILIVLAEDCSFSTLSMLGIPHAKLTDSSGNDKTVNFALEAEERPLRMVLEDLEPLIKIPPSKYIEIEQYESKSSQKNWTIFPVYVNRNDEEVGIYFNWGYSFSNEDRPAFLVLPAYKDYLRVIVKLLKALAKIYPEFIPEITDIDWSTDNKYYPKEVSNIDQKINDLVNETKKKIATFQERKVKAKEKYAYLHDLLTESGDKLKESVIITLTNIFQLEVEDMDRTRKSDLREDLLIKYKNLIILAEVKGTRNSYPSITYVIQVFKHLLLKNKINYPDVIGGLIVNYDLIRNPADRSKAYTKPEENEQLTDIIFVDTRVLFDLALAVLDHEMSPIKAKEILLQKGRVNFSLNQYIKEISNKNEN
ncbi:MAG: hypothetical protein A3A51_03915 [Candidatus Levybacteria bacterium RIFCSPLOWO2_01_FULL_39_10]|nr:MAG: hypothetical protein A3A51_03915 [Candidatus Levybacteria bacterium RIFCSPLOWO2_01_FULL_39_10]